VAPHRHVAFGASAERKSEGGGKKKPQDATAGTARSYGHNTLNPVRSPVRIIAQPVPTATVL